MSSPGADQVSPVLALEPRYYTDPALYEIEREAVFARTWQFAGHLSSLREPGDYLSFAIAEQQLFCIRGQDGEVRAFYNVCQHRAHELVSGAGNCRYVVCPYHNWSYELDGRLRAGRNTASVAGFDRTRIRLTEVRVEILCGFVFVNLDPDAAPMANWFPDVAVELAAFVPDIEQLEPLAWVETPEHCNWKLSVENYSECYHCAINHPTFATGVIKPQTYDIQPQGYCLRHTTECQNLDRMSYAIDPASNEHAGDYSSWYLWPAFSFQVYPGNVLNTYHWRPLDLEHVVVWRGWYTPGGVESDTIRQLAAQDRATTVEEDIGLVESQQRGLKSRGYNPGPLVLDPSDRGVNSEHSLRALHGWIREAVDST